uniref:Uncharacterized protein n=1 Tax=Romanomermis culicivorax TaxID=13658 RepID=A0A915K509_ROMCU
MTKTDKETSAKTPIIMPLSTTASSKLQSDNDNNITELIIEKQPETEVKNPKLPRNYTCDISVNSPNKNHRLKYEQKIDFCIVQETTKKLYMNSKNCAQAPKIMDVAYGIKTKQ